MPETQQSIHAWGVATFSGQATPMALYWRMMKEIAELEMALHCGELEKIPGELADVAIMLHQLASRTEVNLQAAIDAKMRINRNRKWHVSEDGTSQHIEENHGA